MVFPSARRVQIRSTYLMSPWCAMMVTPPYQTASFGTHLENSDDGPFSPVLTFLQAELLTPVDGSRRLLPNNLFHFSRGMPGTGQQENTSQLPRS